MGVSTSLLTEAMNVPATSFGWHSTRDCGQLSEAEREHRDVSVMSHCVSRGPWTHWPQLPLLQLGTNCRRALRKGRFASPGLPSFCSRPTTTMG
jgi:hypothetical protein